MRRAEKVLWRGVFPGWILLAMVMAWPFVLEGEDLGSQNPQAVIAQAEVGPSRVDWLPQVDYERLVLTIAGPGDLYIRREFRSGETPAFSALDIHGGTLPDGVYTYELRAVPRQDPKLRERIAKARERGDDSAVDRLLRGSRSAGPLVQSGHLWVQGGSFVANTPTQPSETRPPLRNAIAKTTISDNLIVTDRACIGPNCVSGDADSGPVLKLKENGQTGLLQIKFEALGAFHPSERQWAIQANDPGAASGANGDFLIRDLTGSKVPFRIGASAPDNALYILYNGNLGLGTLTPAQDVHAISGNSPAVRLEQDGTGGLSARTWDAVGNDVGFFVRDVTNSSTVPFRIRAGAPANSLEVSNLGYVGIGTTSPAAPLHAYASATNDTYIGLGPSPGSGPAFNIGYGGSSFGRGVGFLNVRPDASATAPNPSLRFMTGNVERMILDNEGFIGLGVANPTSPIHHSSGAVLTAGGTWQNASSRSAKHDIQELDVADARAALAGLAPVRFRYNADPGDELLGFIAEDVPELVATSDHKTLSPMDIVAVLTKMVQEQERTIDDLSATVQDLKAKIEEMESRQP